MEIKSKLRPPYASSGIADATLDLFRRISPKKIDTKFIVENQITTQNNAFTATDLVKWLGITDEEGNVIEEVGNKLRLVGEERDKFIRSLIEKAYNDLFEHVNVAEAKRNDVVNYFIHYHNFGAAQARYAAALFAHLCYRYGIPVSEDLRKKSYSQSGEGGTKKKKQEPLKRQRKKETKTEHSETEDLGTNKYIVLIKGENTNFKLPINNLQDYTDLESVLNIIKKKLS
jgi:hypothetical protein